MQVFKPALPFAAVCLAAAPLLPGWLEIGLSFATGLTCMSQQFHAWAHMKGSQLSAGVIALQVPLLTPLHLRACLKLGCLLYHASGVRLSHCCKLNVHLPLMSGKSRNRYAILVLCTPRLLKQLTDAACSSASESTSVIAVLLFRWLPNRC